MDDVPQSQRLAGIVSGRSLLTPLVSKARWSGKAKRSAWFFPDATVSSWHSARIALWQGVHAIGLRSGDRVLVPAYCSGVEAGTLLEAGLQLEYYRIRRDLSPDLEHLAQLCRSPARALLVIHYFGLPQVIGPVVDFAKKRGLLLIEDCAHGLYGRSETGAPLGSSGDIAVFSLRKHLPVPNGGLLVLRKDHHYRFARQARPHIGCTVKSLAWLASMELERRRPSTSDGLRRLLGRAEGRYGSESAPEQDPPGDPAADGERFEVERATWGASWLSRLLYRFADPDEVRCRRARHYRMLLATLLADREGLRPLCREISAGASPWVFPVVARSPAELQRDLIASGVTSHAVWRLRPHFIPQRRFQFEEELRRHVVALPVHQDLTPDEVMRIGAVLQRYGS